MGVLAVAIEADRCLMGGVLPCIERGVDAGSELHPVTT